MTITILRRLPGQAIPRPVNRASSLSELSDLIVGFEQDNRRFVKGMAPQGTKLNLENIDTDKPVALVGPVDAPAAEFFAFTER